ncbi:MAG: hypothetical protein J2P21_01875 [Chloracidobacterium sp.]|nr:hypothetical protein [Chloracidobacterium sp.]
MLFDVGADERGLDLRERGNAALTEPVEELLHSIVIGPSRVSVADRGDEEFDEAPIEHASIFIFTAAVRNVSNC